MYEKIIQDSIFVFLFFFFFNLLCEKNRNDSCC